MFCVQNFILSSKTKIEGIKFGMIAFFEDLKLIWFHSLFII